MLLNEASDYEESIGFAPEPVQHLWEPEDDEYEQYDEYKEEPQT